MELEELKMSWNLLNERLEENEILNKRIIKEMITRRTESAYERLFKLNLFKLVVVIVISLLFPVMYVAGDVGMKTLSFVLLEVTLTLGLISQIFLFSTLAKFDMEKKKTQELIKLALLYKLWARRNYTYGTALALIVLIAYWIIQEVHLMQHGFIGMGFILLYAFIVMCYQIRFYRKNIRTIEKSLEELKEFEEEPPVSE